MLDMLYRRRSIRSFLDKPVEREVVEKLVQGILLSPSGHNKKPWEFIIVNDRDVIARLADAKKHGSQFLAGAPLVVMFLGKPEVSDTWIEDTAIATTILHLHACELGLGSCWVQIRNRRTADEKPSGDYIREVLDIPAEFEVESLVGLGYADETKPAYDRGSLLYQRVHMNGFGNPYTPPE